jgi:hypothetical protein
MRCGGRCSSLAVVLFLLLAFVKALHDRRSVWYQHGLIRKPLRKIGMILHDVEHRFLGESTMVLGKQSVHRCELFIGHGHRAFGRNARIYISLLISRQLAASPVVVFAIGVEKVSIGQVEMSPLLAPDVIDGAVGDFSLSIAVQRDADRKAGRRAVPNNLNAADGLAARPLSDGIEALSSESSVVQSDCLKFYHAP